MEFVNSVVVEGLSAAVMTSLEFLLDQIDPETIKKDGRLPLFEVMLVLNGTDGINFQPPLGHDAANKKGMSDMIDNIVGSFFQIATLFKRLDAEGTYTRELHADLEVTSVLALLPDAIATNDDKCQELKKTFDKYAYLWETDPTSYFADFCENATVVTEHGTRLLDLDKFDKAIQKCVEAQSEVAKYWLAED